ncbi:MAG: hypothetical protein LBJ00_02615 [Planctomycetaceae bacterium]|nr:hypothetical protein [Planctomycetaceae bacterium]
MKRLFRGEAYRPYRLRYTGLKSTEKSTEVKIICFLANSIFRNSLSYLSKKFKNCSLRGN